MTVKLALIDDDTDDRDLFGEAVKEIDGNIICVTASNINDILSDASSQQSFLPHAIFIDVNMPLFSGWDCLNVLRSNTDYDSVPIIMYSTSTNERDGIQAKKLGALGLLSKPADFETLKLILKQIIELIQNNVFNHETFSKLACRC